MELRTLREEEKPAFLDLMSQAFRDVDTTHFARYLAEDPHLGPEDTFVALDGHRLIAAVQLFTRTIGLHGEPVLLGGIGSVATAPAYERRGLATALLRRAIAEMERREMVISLLFTGRSSFYERLGWRSIPHPMLAIRRGQPAGPHAARDFDAQDLDPQDLAGVKALYAHYSGRRDGTTRRDDRYWSAQLRFAGNPGEHFRVLEAPAEGGLVAYARKIQLMGMDRIMEHGCAPGQEGALAELLLTMAPEGGALFVANCDPTLLRALSDAGARWAAVDFPDQMWRVVDRDRLAALAGSGARAPDEAVLDALLGPGRIVYWPSDRF